eukprot:2213642-Ditylum_brightwellii.AAC.1
MRVLQKCNGICQNVKKWDIEPNTKPKRVTLSKAVDRVEPRKDTNVDKYEATMGKVGQHSTSRKPIEIGKKKAMKKG